MDDILQEFLAESWENLGQLDSEIVELEKDPQNAELIASIFRTIHTIKGTCGFLGLTNLGAVAHSAENVLGKMREGLLDVSPGAISLVLEAIDKIKELLQGLEATGEEPKTDHSTLTSMLDDLAEFATNGGGDTSVEESAPAETTTQAAAASESNPSAESSESTSEVQDEPVAASPETTSEVKPEASEPAVPASVAEDTAAKSSKVSVADLSIRVNVNVVDSLMNLVGELVLTRNQLLQLA